MTTKKPRIDAESLWVQFAVGLMALALLLIPGYFTYQIVPETVPMIGRLFLGGFAVLAGLVVGGFSAVGVFAIISSIGSAILKKLGYDTGDDFDPYDD